MLVPAFQAFAFGYAVVPFLIILTRERGLGVGDYAALQSIYYTTTLAAELPTGVVADRVGRKPVLVLAVLLQMAGFCAIARANDFFMFACAEVLLGLAQAMLSGTTSAILFDTLHALGRTGEYLRFESRSVVSRLAGTSGAFLLGGALGQAAGIEATAWASFALSGAAVCAGFMMIEPPRESHRKSAAALLISALRDVAGSRDLRWITCLFAALFVALRVAFHFYTIALDRAGVTELIWIGAVYSMLNLVAAGATRAAPRLNAAAGERRVLIGILFLLAISFAGLAAFDGAGAAILCFAAQQVPFGVHFPIVASFVNARVAGDRRATVLSCLSLVGRASFAILFPWVGAAAERSFAFAMAGVSAAFLAVGVVFSVTSRNSSGLRSTEPKN